MERCLHKDNKALHKDHEFCMKCYLKGTSDFLTNDCDQCKSILRNLKRSRMTCSLYHQEYKDPIYLCPNHILCKECVKEGFNSNLACIECNTRMKKKTLCFQHAKFINKATAILNIDCKNNHTYCFKSYFECLIASNFPLACCNKIFETQVNSNSCNICRKKGSYIKHQVCNTHYYCIFCLNQLKKPEYSNYISKIDFCNKCILYFKTNANNDTQCSQDESISDADDDIIPDKNIYNHALTNPKPKLKPINKNLRIEDQDYEANSPKRISQIFLIPIQAMSIVFKPDKKILGAELVPESLGKCPKCQIPGKILECDHVFCLNCTAENFNITFNAFVYYIEQGMFQYLIPEKHRLGCLVEDCYNQYCFPFVFFQDAAKIILTTNYSGYYHEQFLDLYGAFFEGFPMEFRKCSNCKKNFGYYPHDCTCLYCGIRNS
ncbi:hypothetical protein SteCoe_7977 [Stentor coeruleus]|uniref:RING-type domain-containing protein n=1 Tax=Stentor coeruleus TaxID=5963 RepID=A0A1R2CLB0_9CILI|nr:hypothetical protein SteCoe_7977 [Stentor coeruleus]